MMMVMKVRTKEERPANVLMTMMMTMMESECENLTLTTAHRPN